MSKIYFSGSIAGGRDDILLYNKIINFIKKTDIVLTEHIGKRDYQISNRTKEDTQDVYNQDIKWLEESDFVIAECSKPSLGVGYEMAYAEKLNKPVYIFYRKGIFLSAMLDGNKNLNCFEYSSEKELFDKIELILKLYKNNSNKKRIIICSMNKAKNDAVTSVVKDYFRNFDLIPIKTESGVSETPTSDEEGIKGCYNRIKDAMKQTDADMYIAMEGIVSTLKYGTYLCGWTVIYDKETNSYLSGCSAKIKIPDEISKNIASNSRLSEVVAKYMNSTDEYVSLVGTNGLLTHGEYTRTDEFKDSILCAISSKYEKLRRKK